MIIISDTSPLRYLIEVRAINMLPVLYGHIMTTPQVMAELQFEHFPPIVQDWAKNPPEWLRIEQSKIVHFLDTLSMGEASALSLAQQRTADIVLMDAGASKLIDFEQTIRILVTQTRFRYTKALIDKVITEFRQRTQK